MLWHSDTQSNLSQKTRIKWNNSYCTQLHRICAHFHLNQFIFVRNCINLSDAEKISIYLPCACCYIGQWPWSLLMICLILLNFTQNLTRISFQRNSIIETYISLNGIVIWARFNFNLNTKYQIHRIAYWWDFWVVVLFNLSENATIWLTLTIQYWIRQLCGSVWYTGHSKWKAIFDANDVQKMV